MSTRLSRRKRTHKEIDYRYEGQANDLMDNYFKTFLRVNDKEFDFIIENMNDQEMDLMLETSKNYIQKKQFLSALHKYMEDYVKLSIN